MSQSTTPLLPSWQVDFYICNQFIPAFKYKVLVKSVHNWVRDEVLAIERVQLVWMSFRLCAWNRNLYARERNYRFKNKKTGKCGRMLHSRKLKLCQSQTGSGNYSSRVPIIPQGFSQNFWWGGGDLLSGTIFGPHWDRVRWGRLASGTESDEGGLEKISAEAKNTPLSKIRANFGVLKSVAARVFYLLINWPM